MDGETGWERYEHNTKVSSSVLCIPTHDSDQAAQSSDHAATVDLIMIFLVSGAHAARCHLHSEVDVLCEKVSEK